MKSQYTTPLFNLITTMPQEFCAESVSVESTATGIFAGNSDSFIDKDYD